MHYVFAIFFFFTAHSLLFHSCQLSFHCLEFQSRSFFLKWSFYMLYNSELYLLFADSSFKYFAYFIDFNWKLQPLRNLQKNFDIFYFFFNTLWHHRISIFLNHKYLMFDIKCFHVLKIFSQNRISDAKKSELWYHRINDFAFAKSKIWQFFTMPILFWS